MTKQEEKQPAYLLLQDGTVFVGCSFGAQGTVLGEVVFTTGMTAYQETLTDPSYNGQMVVQTFPLVGNYGVNSKDSSSARAYAKGCIVREWCEEPSNFRMEHNLDWFLKEQKVVGLCNIDTRALTRHLREHGVMNGMLSTQDVRENKEEKLRALAAFSCGNLVKEVSVQEPAHYAVSAPCYKVALLDFGVQKSTVQSLLERGCKVTVLPFCTTAKEIEDGHFDGLVLSGGPGDPQAEPEVVATLATLAATSLPIFGMGLGHQLLALAHGCKISKMKYGHRGANQPVLELATGLTSVTSQNHGYEVVCESLKPQVGKVSHINVNDHGCEGIVYGNGHSFTVQFQPETAGGTADTRAYFNQFIAFMKKQKGVE